MSRAQSPREPLPGAASPRPPLSRRRFLQRAGLGAAGMAVAGPALLAACTASGASSRLRTVRVVNEPLAIDDNTPKLFERATGIFLQYTEYTDPDEYLRSISAGLQAHRDIGADVVIVPDALTAKMISSGWARPLDLVAARGRAVPQFANPAFDPGRKYSLPYASTMVGLAYDRRRVTEPIRSVGALFDPRFAGKVALSADAASTLGLVTAALGLKPAAVTPSQASAAVARVRTAVEAGQIRSFATTEYVDDLVSGRALLAIARADDIRDAKIVNPSLTFVVPSEGGILSSTNMVVPIGTPDVTDAQGFIDYTFAPAPSSRLASFANEIMSVNGGVGALQLIDPKAAADPLVVPDPAVWSRLAIWGGNTAATADATAKFAALVASHAGPVAR